MRFYQKNMFQKAILLSAVAIISSTALSDNAKARTDSQEYINNTPHVLTFSGNYLAALEAASKFDILSSSYFFKRALADDPENPDLQRQLVYFEILSGRFDHARPFAVQMVEESMPGNNLAEFFLILDDAKHMNYKAAGDAARNLLDQADTIGMDPFSLISTHMMYAWILLGQGDVGQALDHLFENEIIAEFKFMQEYHAALIADIGGLSDRAQTHYQAAIDINPTSNRLVEAYARSLAHNGKAEAAENIINNFLETISPQKPVNIEALMKDITAGKDIELLIGDSRNGLAESTNNLALVLEGQQSFQAALLFHRFALMMKADYSPSQFSAGSLFYRLDQSDFAIEQFSAINTMDPLWDRSRIELASIYRSRDEMDKAKTVLTDLIELRPNQIIPLMAMGNLLRFQKEFEDAAHYYDKAIGLVGSPQPTDWQLYYYRGISYERSKKWPLAEEDFKMALKLNPDNPNVLNYLGYSWIDQDLNYELALDYIKKAVEQEESGYIIDSLGWAYYKLGRFEEAVNELEKALSLSPADPTINDHLGDAYWQVGRKREAGFQWAHALSLDPDEDQKADIERKIEIGLDAYTLEKEENQDLANHEDETETKENLN